MMSYIILGEILTTLTLAVFSLALITRLIKRNNNVMLKALGFVSLNLNLVWLLGVVFEILKSTYSISENPLLALAFDIFFSSCIFMFRFIFLYVFFELFENILNLTILNQFKSALKKAILIVAGIWVLAWIEIPLNKSKEIVNNLMIYTDILVFASVIILSLYMFHRAKLIIDKRSKVAIRYLGIIFIFTFILAFFKWIVGGSLGGVNQSLARILLYSFLLLFNLLVTVWVLRFGFSLLKRIGYTSKKAKNDLAEIAFRYEISKREIDIIALICEGKTNKEIADILFISLETVKDHNHNIFQKTGVKNRTQLANLFNSYRD